jgi:thioredoxin 1
MPWRLALVAALLAAVALVLASKPTREGATDATLTGVTTPTAPPGAAAVTATGTQAPPAPATTASADLNPVVSHAPSEPAGLPRLVDLGADRCVPCKAMAPILVELRQQYAGRMQVDFIDVWKNPSAGDPYNIYSIPTQIFFDERGRELTRHMGFLSKDGILATWKRVGYDFSIPGPATPKS